MNNKKVYSSPELSIYGDVEELTLQNGTNFTDVPKGTPNTGPGSVTGS